MLPCNTCLIRSRAICGALNGDELAALNAIGRTRVLKAGEPLMWKGPNCWSSLTSSRASSR